MENACTAQSFAGYGTELDWLRALWDYHTNPGTRPGHEQMLEQLRGAHDDVDFSRSKAYERMLDYAAMQGFAARWVEMGTWNGIDY